MTYDVKSLLITWKTYFRYSYSTCSFAWRGAGDAFFSSEILQVTNNINCNLYVVLTEENKLD